MLAELMRLEELKKGALVGVLSTCAWTLCAVVRVFSGFRLDNERVVFVREKGKVREVMGVCPVDYVRGAEVCVTVVDGGNRLNGGNGKDGRGDCELC